MDSFEAKDKIIKEFISNAPFDGWSRHNLKNCCKNMGLEDDYDEILFPSGIGSLTSEVVELVNQKFEKQMYEYDFEGLRVTEKIERAILFKVQSYHNFLDDSEVLKKFSAYCLNLDELSLTSSNIFGFSDKVWRYFGDNSTDFNFYTKRLSLSNIYVKSFTYSLTDKSEGLEDTQHFIKRCIDGLMKFHKLKAKILSFIPGANFLKK